jgi:hypothetical protein
MGREMTRGGRPQLAWRLALRRAASEPGSTVLVAAADGRRGAWASASLTTMGGPRGI